MQDLDLKLQTMFREMLGLDPVEWGPEKECLEK